jgi:16S rRNA (adenine1518-N6/adenine1519-N6)-dimethyltransferase
LPRKLGQHFLTNESILEQLAIAACGEHNDRTIEIGPGRGALTRHLLKRTNELHAVEIDGRLVAYLQEKWADEPRFHVHQADVLATDLGQWGPATITGNLPYYITSPIIDKFLQLDASFPVAVFLMQWEVAQRLLASPGTRDYGFLTVAARLVCDLDLVCKVPPSAFRPPPQVDSAAVRFVRKREQPIDKASLLLLASRSFAQKRKTLRNNLRPFYGTVIDSFPEAGLRAEQLTIENFIDLHQRLRTAQEQSLSYTEIS